MVGGIESSERSATGAPVPVLPLEKAVVHEHPQQLLHEQRVPFGGRRDAHRSVPRQARLAQQVLDQELALVLAERPEHRPCSRSSAGVNAGTGLPQLGTSHVEQEDGLAAAVVLQVLEEVEKRGLGPVEIVEDDHER